MAHFTIIGHNGFIGQALAKRLGTYSTTPTPETRYLFYLGGCVHPDFEKNPEYWHNKVMQDFLYLLPYCEQHGIKFIYASSALVYEKDTNFANHKKSIELLASMYNNTLGLRIFPVYGKGDHNTFISQAINAIKNDISPEIWGDGTQARDFICVDDVVNQIMQSINEMGVIDIGTGQLTSFNEIVKIINEHLGKDIKPKYINKSLYNYSEGIFTKKPLPVSKSINEHIKDILG